MRRTSKYDPFGSCRASGEGELVGIGLMDWIEKGVEFAEAGEVGDKVMMIAHSFV